MPAKIQILVNLSEQTAYWRGVIAGVARYCREHPDVSMRLPSPGWDLVDDGQVIDGVIAVVTRSSADDSSARFGKPIVNISSIAEGVPFPSVIVDGRACGRLAAEHLLKQGYEHFSCHVATGIYFSRERLHGFTERLREAGRDCLVFDTDSPTLPGRAPRELRAATTEWLAKLPRPQGLFTHNDLRGAMILDMCREAGLAIPDQIGVVSIDNDESLVLRTSPPLSSIDPAADDVGYRAAALMLDVLNDRPLPPTPIQVPPRGVIARASTRPSRLDDDVIALALNFIRDNALKQVTVADILEAVPVSRRVLERRFSEHLGSSVGNEIRRVRIETSKRLMMTTNASLKEVAAAVGYREYRNFATAFRRETGTSPAEFRKDRR